jgi:hypothetical protein
MNDVTIRWVLVAAAAVSFFLAAFRVSIREEKPLDLVAMGLGLATCSLLV